MWANDVIVGIILNPLYFKSKLQNMYPIISSKLPVTWLTTYNSTAHQCVLRAQLGNSTLKTASHFSSPPPLYNFLFLSSHVLPLQVVLSFRLYVLIIMRKRRKIQVFTKILISSLWHGHTGTSQPDWEEQATWSLGKMWIFAGSKVHTHTHKQKLTPAKWAPPPAHISGDGVHLRSPF